MKWKSPPVPPKPPDEQIETESQSRKRLQYLAAERHMAPISFLSQVTSTSLGSIESTRNNDFEPIPWEPPIEHENKSEVRFQRVD